MNHKYLTVTALTRYIKSKIEADHHLQLVLLKGEISNFYLHQRGHMYFTIKDDQTRISAVMFKGNNQHLKFKPENGMQVLIEGEVNVYEPYGQYQLYVKKMQPDGIGSLYFAFEQMKEKLRQKGYFESKYKREIPQYPKKIGIITSPFGAAVKDILTTIKRRNPYVNLTVIPTIVQGTNAKYSIVKAIETANLQHKFDVLIVGRGGGSIEDLWAFNEESVADAIFHSKIPIISAVGHETDITISDYVADLRAITPTAAGELVVKKWEDMKESHQQLQQQLTNSFKYIVTKKTERLNQFKKAYAFHLPQQLIYKNEQRIDQNQVLLNKNILAILRQQKQKFSFLERQLHANRPERQLILMQHQLQQSKQSLNKLIKQKVDIKQQRINNYIDKLLLLNPLEIMKRGYAIPYKNNVIIKSVEHVTTNDKISIKLINGKLTCLINEIERNDENE